VLAADLKAKLDSSSLVDTFVGAISASTGTLGSVTPPIGPAQISAHADLSASVSTSGVSASIGGVASQRGGLLGALPDPAAALGQLGSALELVEKVSGSDPATQIPALLDRLAAQLSGPRSSSALDLMRDIAAALSAAPELKPLVELLSTLLQAGADPFQILGEVPAAFVGTIQALGALMSLKSLLAEGERLTRIMAVQFDPGRITIEVAALRTSSSEAAAALAALSSAPAPDADQAGRALEATQACSLKLAGTRAVLAQAMGFGEATLIHLDPAGLKSGLQAATTRLRAVDADAIGRAVKSLVDRLTPALRLDLQPAAASTFDTVLKAIENETANIAAAIAAVDVMALTKPLQAGLAQLTGVADALARVVTQVTMTIRGALEQVRQAVAALPLDQIERAVQNALAPVTTAMDAIGQLIGSVEDALKTAAQTVTGALADVEHAVDALKAALAQLFHAAKDFVATLHLDQAAGTMAGDINAFTDALAKAQMKPYFDTASGTVNTTAGAISALPLALLPASMKADLDAAVAPIRAINIEQVKDEIDGLLAIQGGTFELRGSLEQAIAAVKQDFDALIAELDHVDPRQLVAPIDGALADVKSKTHGLVPQLSLKPLDDAVASIKQALAAFDLRAELAPVSQMFADVLAAVDRFSPDALIRPLEDRVKAARDRVTNAIGLAQWLPEFDKLAAQAQSVIDLVDPQTLQLESRIADALGEANALIDQLDQINLFAPFGDFVAALLAGGGGRIEPAAFDAVSKWLGGASGAAELSQHAAAIATAIHGTQSAIEGLDLQGLAATLAQDAAAMNASVGALSGDIAVRADIAAVVGHLNVDSFAALAANQARYLSELGDASSLVATLTDTGLSQADATVTALAAAFAPAAILREFFDKLLGQIGLGSAQGGVAGLLRSVLATVTPARLAGLLEPIAAAVRARATLLLNSVLAPMRDAVSKFVAAVNAIDLAPLRVAIDAVFQQVRGEIAALDPLNILAPVLKSFAALKAKLAAFDPLKDLHAIIDALVTTADRVLDKLKAEAILADPIAIFDEIKAAVNAIDPQVLLQPVLDLLDTVAAEVANGLDELAKAIERLQAALPAPGTSAAGAALSVAASVGVSF
jgi:hypothetical protein